MWGAMDYEFASDWYAPGIWNSWFRALASCLLIVVGIGRPGPRYWAPDGVFFENENNLLFSRWQRRRDKLGESRAAAEQQPAVGSSRSWQLEAEGWQQSAASANSKPQQSSSNSSNSGSSSGRRQQQQQQQQRQAASYVAKHRDES